MKRLLFLFCLVVVLSGCAQSFEKRVKKYDSVEKVTDNFFKVTKDYKIGFVDSDGILFVPLEYSDARTYKNNIIIVRKGYWGAINKAGQVVIPFDYAELSDFNEHGIAVAAKPDAKSYSKKNYGMIDKNNRTVVPFVYTYIEEFNEGGSARAASGGFWHNNEIRDAYWGLLDGKGNELSPFVWWTIGEFNQGLAACERKNSFAGYGYMDYNGKMVIREQFRFARDFNEYGIAVVDPQSLGYSQIIDTKGRKVSGRTFSHIGTFVDGIAPAGTTDYHSRHGYIDTKANTVIPFIYDVAHNFSDGLAAVRLPNHRVYGYINTKGELVIPYKYTWPGEFKDGKASVSLGTSVFRERNTFFYIDKTGNVLD